VWSSSSRKPARCRGGLVAADRAAAWAPPPSGGRGPLPAAGRSPRRRSRTCQPGSPNLPRSDSSPAWSNSCRKPARCPSARSRRSERWPPGARAGSDAARWPLRTRIGRRGFHRSGRGSLLAVGPGRASQAHRTSPLRLFSCVVELLQPARCPSARSRRSERWPPGARAGSDAARWPLRTRIGRRRFHRSGRGALSAVGAERASQAHWTSPAPTLLLRGRTPATGPLSGWPARAERTVATGSSRRQRRGPVTASRSSRAPRIPPVRARFAARRGTWTCQPASPNLPCSDSASARSNSCKPARCPPARSRWSKRWPPEARAGSGAARWPLRTRIGRRRFHRSGRGALSAVGPERASQAHPNLPCSDPASAWSSRCIPSCCPSRSRRTETVATGNSRRQRRGPV